MFSPLLAKLGHYVELDTNDASKLRTLDARFIERRAGSILMQEGDRHDNLVLLLKGWAIRYKILRNGGRQVLGYMLPGDIGDPHPFLPLYADYSISLITDSSIALVPRSTLIGLAADRPAIASALLWSVAIDSAITRYWVVGLGRQDAYARIAHLFCELHDRATLLGLAADDEMILPLTQVDLADTLGITAVHTNRVLQRMRHENLLKFQSKRLVITDLPTMRLAAEYDPAYLSQANSRLM